MVGFLCVKYGNSEFGCWLAGQDKTGRVWAPLLGKQIKSLHNNIGKQIKQAAELKLFWCIHLISFKPSRLDEAMSGSFFISYKLLIPTAECDITNKIRDDFTWALPKSSYHDIKRYQRASFVIHLAKHLEAELNAQHIDNFICSI